MAQGIIGDILSGASAIPLIGSPIAITRGLAQAAEGKNPGQTFAESIPGIGSVIAGAHIADGTGAAQGQGGAGSQPADTQAQNLIKGLTFGQEQNPNQQLLTQLSQLLGGMSAPQAQALLAGPNVKGTNLASELSSVLGGEPVSEAISAHQAQVDPNYTGNQSAAYSDTMAAILGSVFQHTLAPFLAQTNAATSQGVNADIGAMKQALQGGSPQMQAAMKGVPEELSAAEKLQSQAATEQAATAPGYAEMIQALGNAFNQYKLAQGAYQLAPYYTQMIQTGQVPRLPGVAPTGLLPPPG